MLSTSIFSNFLIMSVVALTWSLCLKVRHDKGNGSKECFRIQAHFHKCGKVRENEFQHFEMDCHFGSWNLMSV